MSSPLPPPGSKYAFLTISIICMFHTFGSGAFVIVLYDFLTIAICNNDLALSTAYWGTFLVAGRIIRLLCSPLIGWATDKLGRRSFMLINLSSLILMMLVTYFIPSIVTFFLGGIIDNALNTFDVPLYAIIADLGKHRVAVITTNLYGYLSSVYVLAFGVITVVASIIVDVGKTAALDDLREDLNITEVVVEEEDVVLTSNCTNADGSAVEVEEELLLTTINHLDSTVYLSIICVGIGALITIFFLKESQKWGGEAGATGDAATNPLQCLKIIWKSPYYTTLTGGLIVIEACQMGTIGSLFWFCKYQFNYTSTDFSLLLLWALFCAAIATTINVKYFVRKIGLWPSLNMSCVAGCVGLWIIGLSGQLGPIFAYVGISCNLFNVAKPILRAKLCAEFKNEEQGKAQSILFVATTFGSMLGTFIATSLLSLAIAVESGVEGDVEDVDYGCVGDVKTLLSGSGFFVLGSLSGMALRMSIFARSIEPKEDVENRAASERSVKKG